MEQKKWRVTLDKYINTGKLLSEEYEEMDEIQKIIIQELKKAYKRLNYENTNLCWEEQKQNYR